MPINNNCDDGICRSFKVKVNSDGSFEPLGISGADFNALFPNFSVRVDGEGQLTVDNFYNDNASIDKQNPTQIVMGNKIVADGVLTVVPSSAAQITSWQYKANGITGTNVPNISDIEDDDYPTLTEVLNSVSSTERDSILRITTPSYQAYVEQVVEVLDGELLPNIQKITIELSTGEIESGEVLNSAGETITKDRGLTTVVVVPDIEHFTGEPIFKIEAGVAELKLYAGLFKGLAKESVCSYVQTLVDMAKVATDSKVLITLYDYHYPQSFSTGVGSDTEPMENLLTTLLKLDAYGLDLSDRVDIHTPYGKYDSLVGEWNYSTAFHHNTGSGTVILEDTHRFDYELGCIATVSNLVGGMSWDGMPHGIRITDSVSISVMAVLKYGVGNIEMSNDSLPPLVTLSNGQLSISTMFNNYGALDFLEFMNGSRDVEFEYQDGNGDTQTENFIYIDGISKIANEKYLLKIDKSKRPIITSLGIPYQIVEKIGELRPHIVNLIDLNHIRPSMVGLAMVLLTGFADTVHYEYASEGDNITVTSGSYVATGKYESSVLHEFSSHTTRDSEFSDSVLTIKNTVDGYSYIKQVVNFQQVDIIDVSLLSEANSLSIISDLGNLATWKIAHGHIIGNVVELVHLAYAGGLNITSNGVSINPELEQLMSKHPLEYYEYILGDDTMYMSPKIGMPYLTDSPVHKIGKAYEDILNFLKDDVTNGATEQLKYFIENDIPIEEGEHFVFADLSKVATSTRTHASGGDTHSEYTYTFTTNSLNISTSTEVLFDPCGWSGENVAIARIMIMIDSSYSIQTTKLGSIHTTWEYEITECPIEGCINHVESSAVPQIVDINNNYIHYTFTENPDGSVTVNYTAYDKDDNDITDQFNTLSLGDYFLHKEVE